MIPSNRLLWLIALVGAPAAAAGGLVPSTAPLMLALIALAAIAVMADLVSRNKVFGRLAVSTDELVRMHRDRGAEIQIRLTSGNASGRTLRFGLPLPPSMDTAEEERTIAVADAEFAEFTWACVPRRRGLYRIDGIHVEGASPLGFWNVRRVLPLNLEIRVYPNLRESDALAALRRGAQGFNALRQVGKGREFEKLREYAPGDDFSEIHWKATARRGKPVTKVYQVERTQEIYVIIDAARLSARPAGKDVTLERYINAALVLGSAAEHNGDLFGLVTFSDQVHGFVRARNGKAHYAACRDALFQLHPRAVSPDFDELASFLRVRLRRRALLLFLTELDDPLLSESFARAMRLLSGQHAVVAGMLKPPGVAPLFTEGSVTSEDDVLERLGGHIAWRSLKELEISLRRQGVRFSLLVPDLVCQQLVGVYQEIKQRQII